MGSQLALSFLGTFQTQLNGELVTNFEYDKVRALLAYLAVENEFPHRREVMSAFLWPEQPDKEARHSLSQALSTCRQALGDRDREVPFILADRHTIQWNPAVPACLDVRQFEALLSDCADHSHGRAETCTDCGACVGECPVEAISPEE